jgi:hypothetical protein
MTFAPDPEHAPRISRETLHALVVDDACGQLAADVAELLHAWLAGHPDDARDAVGIRAAVGLVGRACRLAGAPPAVSPAVRPTDAPATPRASAAAAAGGRASLPAPAGRGLYGIRHAAVVGAVAASLAVVAVMTWRPRQPALERRPEPEPAAVAPIQWTRYVLATDQSGRFTFKPVQAGGTP